MVLPVQSQKYAYFLDLPIAGPEKVKAIPLNEFQVTAIKP
jgi:hypothetical protein